MLSDIDASPAIDEGRVFAIGQGGRMAAVELATGQRVWEVNIAGISTPWAAGDWDFVVTSDARLLCLSRGTGKIRWATQLPAYKNEKKRTKQIRWSGSSEERRVGKEGGSRCRDRRARDPAKK